MDKVFRDHAKTVYKYLMTLTGDADLSEELTQETFYQAVKASDRFDGSCKMTTWLCAIAKNQLAAYRRKHRPTVSLEGEAEAGTLDGTMAGALESAPGGTTAGVSAEQEVLSRMGSVEIVRQIHELEEPYREVLYLRLFGNLSFAEIGAICRKSENWARVTFYRGKEKVRRALE